MHSNLLIRNALEQQLLIRSCSPGSPRETIVGLEKRLLQCKISKWIQVSYGGTSSLGPKRQRAGRERDRAIAEERSPGVCGARGSGCCAGGPRAGAQARPAPPHSWQHSASLPLRLLARKCGALSIRVRRGQCIQEEKPHCKQRVLLSKDTCGCF